MTAVASAGPRLSIGQVLAELRPDFDDVTISKIRFLEAEGLVEPARTSAGYRKFSRGDVERLRWVLTVQRERFLPLRVIKDHLDAVDRGLDPPDLPGGSPRVAHTAPTELPSTAGFRPEDGDLRMSRTELVRAAGIDEALLAQLESFGLVRPGPGGRHYDGQALVIARTAGQLAAFGLEARHLRTYKTAADRQVGLVEQVVTPLRRRRNAEAQARSQDATRELAELSVRLHAALVHAGLQTSQ